MSVLVGKDTKLIVQGTPQDVKTEAWLMSAGFRLPVGKR